MREANNLLVVASLAFASRLALEETGLRLVLSVLLNIYAYLLNDLCDLGVDHATPHRQTDKVAFLRAHRSTAIVVLAVIAAVLHGFAWLVGRAAPWPLTLFSVASSVVLVSLYSFWLKRLPIADILAMALAGATGTLLGASFERGSWVLVGVAGLICGAYQAVQLLRDIDVDRAQGVGTTAVVLGTTATAWILRLLLVAGAAYGVWVVGSYWGCGLLLALVVPYRGEHAARSWDMLRLVSGGVWLALLIELYFA
ncbi:MAG: UbiA prenyltransferase family protein [Deltaproteobacteria bacterium]|nr:UbiA prenyltransferase family protein [Deltaproteobacteria bacterium]